MKIEENLSRGPKKSNGNKKRSGGMRKICLCVVYTCMKVSSCSTGSSSMKMHNKIVKIKVKKKNAVRHET